MFNHRSLIKKVSDVIKVVMYACTFYLVLLAFVGLLSQTIAGSSFRPAVSAGDAAIARSLVGAANLAAGGKTPLAPDYVPGKMILTSEFSRTDFVPDGDLDKKAWATAKKASFDQDAFQRTAYPEIETSVASRWTEKYLYLAYWCKYRTLNIYQGEDPRAERWELWERDVVEAFINPQPAQPVHYYEFEIAPNNQWLDLEIDLHGKRPHNAQWNSGFEHATRVYPARHIWTVEMRIPVRSMGVQRIDPNIAWRINLYRADGPGSGEKRRLLSWSPLAIANNSFHQPASFGILKFASPVRSKNF